jgi:GxxExxY protein
MSPLMSLMPPLARRMVQETAVQNSRKVQGMHDRYLEACGLTESVIGAAIEVHRDKGPGLLESVYEWCLLRELQLRGLSTVSQKSVVIEYKGATNEQPLRFDVLVEGCLLVEVKAVERILPIHKAQLLSYMKLLDVPLGLLINFNVERLVDGVSRLVLPGHGDERLTGEVRGYKGRDVLDKLAGAGH